jgi:hypothetical protein
MRLFGLCSLPLVTVVDRTDQSGDLQLASSRTKLTTYARQCRPEPKTASSKEEVRKVRYPISMEHSQVQKKARGGETSKET